MMLINYIDQAILFCEHHYIHVEVEFIVVL